MKIAVVGAGISGLGAALALGETHDVQVFEADTRVGGHANTVDAVFPDGVQPVDTGFIVYNYRNYPNLTALFDRLGVATKWSDMSFGFSLRGGQVEYACDNLNTLFAQRWRIADLRHISGLRQIKRFIETGPAELESGRLAGLSLSDWLAGQGFTDWFRERFILPMGSAIWSTSSGKILDFPAEHFLRFFCNHDLMTGLNPAQRWRTVEGGSRAYVGRVRDWLGDRITTGQAVVSVTGGAQPSLRLADGSVVAADHILLACHGPQAQALLTDAPDSLRQVLSAFRTSQNRAILHSDPSLMPRLRRVWSSWNFLSDGMETEAESPAQVTYWMNRLQSIPADRPLFVSLNPRHAPDPALTHGAYDYAHPLFDADSFAAQQALERLQGQGGLWFAGAWLGYGFHEDGLRAGLRVAAALGARPDWAKDLVGPQGTGAAAEGGHVRAAE
ncbi:MAG: FAD-dependent oxidoreductase [Pseudomonadota bacterium]